MKVRLAKFDNTEVIIIARGHRLAITEVEINGKEILVERGDIKLGTDQRLLITDETTGRQFVIFSKPKTDNDGELDDSKPVAEEKAPPEIRAAKRVTKPLIRVNNEAAKPTKELILDTDGSYAEQIINYLTGRGKLPEFIGRISRIAFREEDKTRLQEAIKQVNASENMAGKTVAKNIKLGTV